jgi:hypothetical protein
MSFVYQAPLQFQVPVTLQDGIFGLPPKDVSLPVKYLQEADCDAPLPYNKKSGEVEIVSIWRNDGRTEIDKRWWRIRYVRDLREEKNGDRVSLLEVSFKGEAFAHKILNDKRCAEGASNALADAFFEQDTIQILIDAGDVPRLPEAAAADKTSVRPPKEAKAQVKEAANAGRYQASLILKLSYVGVLS